MNALPDMLNLELHRDRRAWRHSPWIRRVLLLIPSALVVAALLNMFGQRPVTSVGVGHAAVLTVSAPTRGRSGLIYAARFQIDALRTLKNATLVLDPGWADGYTVNGNAPEPLTEASRDGKPTFGFGHIAAGQHLTFWLSLQINPTTIGRHRQSVWLYDGRTLITQVNRTILIFP